MPKSKSKSYTPGWIVGKNRIANYGSYHWILGRAAWERFILELYRPIPIYEITDLGSQIIDYDYGPHLDITLTYSLTTAYIHYDNNDNIIAISGLHRDGRKI